MITHHVKRIGESPCTDCGLHYINNNVSVTQDGEVTCKDCLKLLNLSKRSNS